MAYLLDTINENEIFNSCGKVVYNITPLEQLKRFMFLGTEHGSFYIQEKSLTAKNLDALETLLSKVDNHTDIIKVMNEYTTKTFKRDYLIYVLARCCAYPLNKELRENSYMLLNRICTTPTHLFLFLELYEALYKKYNGSTGWNKMHKAYVASWYLNKNYKDLVYQVTKYKNRNGWTHRDVLRLSHIKPPDDVCNTIFRYIAYDELDRVTDDYAHEYLFVYDLVSTSKDKEFVIEMIRKWGFVREHISTELQTDVDVMNELAQNMPLIATLRTMNRLTHCGVFEKYPATKEAICQKLRNKEYIKKSGVHPLQFLIAAKTYARGHGDLGKLKWLPDIDIGAALDDAFYSSFDNAQRTDKRYLLALDVSGSMTWSSVCGIQCLQASEVACAMALIMKNVESHCDVMGFANIFRELEVDTALPLEQNMNNIYSSSFGSTDISLPLIWANENKKQYDVMIVFTDCETNCNRMTPAEALRKYRASMNNQCKLIVVSLCANEFTIADPNDKGMLDITGFDAGTPCVINEFVSM